MRPKLTTILALFFLAADAQAQAPVDCIDNRMGPFADLCVHEATVGRIVTIDVKVTELRALGGQIEVPYRNIRSSGAIVQLYYNTIMGKAQWASLPVTQDIHLFPSSILLPVDNWIERGLDPEQIVRIVLLLEQ